MTKSSTAFTRTLPLFGANDRDMVQRLLHHAVADFEYDHPDRKVARDLYHSVREGEAVRLHLGPDLEGVTLVITLEDVAVDLWTVVDRFVNDMRSLDGEWNRVAASLAEWSTSAESSASELKIGFEYLY